MAVANPGLHAQRLPRRIAGDEVDARGGEPVALEVRGRPHGEAIGGRVDVDDVARAPLPETEPATLADRVGRDAGVGAEHAAIPVDDGPRLEQVRVAPAQEAAVVVVGHEADLLALRLVGRDEAEPPRVRAHVVLVEVAHGKVRRREL